MHHQRSKDSTSYIHQNLDLETYLPDHLASISKDSRSSSLREGADVTNRLELLQECRLVDCRPGRPPVADVMNRLKFLQECRLVDCHPGRELTAARRQESTSPVLVLAP